MTCAEAATSGGASTVPRKVAQLIHSERYSACCMLFGVHRFQSCNSFDQRLVSAATSRSAGETESLRSIFVSYFMGTTSRVAPLGLARLGPCDPPSGKVALCSEQRNLQSVTRRAEDVGAWPCKRCWEYLFPVDAAWPDGATTSRVCECTRRANTTRRSKNSDRQSIVDRTNRTHIITWRRRTTSWASGTMTSPI